MHHKYFIKFIFFCLLLIYSQSLFGAGPISHWFFAEKFNDLFNPLNKEEYLVGNLYPDIRYLGKVTREETHYLNVTIEDIYTCESSFEKGVFLHSWIDEQREIFAVESGIYQIIEKYGHGYQATFLKLLEDEIYYDQLDKENFKALEVLKNLSIEGYFFFKLYFSDRPSQSLKLLSQLSFNKIPKEILEYWSEILPWLAKDSFFIDYSKRLEEELNQKLQKSEV